jgi:hypothetical protein
MLSVYFGPSMWVCQEDIGKAQSVTTGYVEETLGIKHLIDLAPLISSSSLSYSLL